MSIIQLARLRAENSLHEADIAIGLLKSLNEDLPRLDWECSVVTGSSPREKDFRREGARNLQLVGQVELFAGALEAVASFFTLTSDIDDFARARETWENVVTPINQASGSLLGGFADWYRRLASALMKALKNSIRAEGDELNAVTLPWMAKLLILDPVQELALIRDLAKVSDEIDGTYLKLSGGLRTGQNYPGGKDSAEIVTKQIEVLRKERDYVRVIARVAERFTRGIRDLTAEQSSDLARIARQKAGFYLMSNAMEAFKSASNDIETYIQNLTLNLDNRTSFEADLDAEWTKYKNAVALANKDIEEKTALGSVGSFNVNRGKSLTITRVWRRWSNSATPGGCVCTRSTSTSPGLKHSVWMRRFKQPPTSTVNWTRRRGQNWNVRHASTWGTVFSTCLRRKRRSSAGMR